ncbi:AAA family ATPase [Candidatus Palauibacter sp.]|uniref:AAA family ATPase n=1 Tax=Candidatus Palauibacter sp. TaxID=3101350 RepID=UPI003C6FA223
MTFTSLRIEGWRQFGRVDLDLHPRLTVLTGANGAGKSSLLRIFHTHFGINQPFLATPVARSGGGHSYLTGLFSGTIARLWQKAWTTRSEMSNVGAIVYGNGIKSELQIPTESSVQYNVTIAKQQTVPGIHIDSHAPIMHFQQVGQIPTTIITAQKAYQSYNNEVVQKYQGGHTGYSPIYRMKEAIIAMAMFGEGNSRVQANKEILDAYLGFVETLRTMLPDSLGFQDIAVRPPEVVLQTTSGDFILDAASGGLLTIIDLTWRLHMFSQVNDEFVVTIDEPENHLHPTMQRTLMPRLLKSFPKAQFMIATHSPFMVSSVSDSNVYVLRYMNTETDEIQGADHISPSDATRVVSEKLDTVSRAGNASEILREVLGVKATIPAWVEEDLAQIVARYREIPITARSLEALRGELAGLGYDILYPDALAALTERQ